MTVWLLAVVWLESTRLVFLELAPPWLQCVVFDSVFWCSVLKVFNWLQTARIILILCVLSLCVCADCMMYCNCRYLAVNVVCHFDESLFIESLCELLILSLSWATFDFEWPSCRCDLGMSRLFVNAFGISGRKTQIILLKFCARLNVYL